jgi:amidase
MFGKTSSPELVLTGASNPVTSGPTRNPWDLAYSAGGSSGGAAAAIAAGIVPLAHGSDGGGSIRVPASVCGLVGLKPTRARTPSGPVRGEGWAGLSCQHVLTRSVRDCAAMLDATAGPELGDPYDVRAPLRPFLDEVAIRPSRLRIGMTTCRLDGSEAEPEVLNAMAEVARLLEELGHHIEPFRHEISFEEIGTHFSAITSANVAYSIVQREKELGRLAADDEMEHLTRFLCEMGRSAPGINYVAAVNYAHGLGRRVATVHERLDVIFGPTCTVPAMPLHVIDMNGDLGEHLAALQRFVPSISIYNMTGQPSISLPLTWSRAGIPIGSMFTAAFGEDGLLLQLAGELERELPWKGHRPPFPAASASSLQADAPTFQG